MPTVRPSSHRRAAAAAPPPRRRAVVFGVVAAAAWAGLAGCAVGPAPPLRLLQLPLDAPAGADGGAAPPGDAGPPGSARAADGAIEVGRVTLPEALERDALLVADGPSQWRVVPDTRWAEPLRDSVPRLLRRDLAALLGEHRVWRAPAPAGVVVARRLVLDVLLLQADPAAGVLRLQAQWTLTDPQALAAPLQGRSAVLVPLAGAGGSSGWLNEVQAVVAAHRQALWLMARDIARQIGPGSGG